MNISISKYLIFLTSKRGIYHYRSENSLKSVSKDIKRVELLIYEEGKSSEALQILSSLEANKTLTEEEELHTIH